MTVDLVIPTYRPGELFRQLLTRLNDQTRRPDHLLVLNTEESFWDDSVEACFPGMEVLHIRKQEFDHGAARRRAASLLHGDILVFMTQDAYPADRLLIERLIAPLLCDPMTGASYARQLPGKDARELERFTRRFNYPDTSQVRSEADRARYGIKTYFCSNVCAAYNRRIYDACGGFPERAIFNEDMIYVGHMVQQGYKVAYAADARVIHSHNYTAGQQFRRNFDLGVSQADHPEVFAQVSSEGEGLKLVRQTAGHLVRTGHILQLPALVWQTASKYAGYRLGKAYQRLPQGLVKRCSMNKEYWKKTK